MCGCQGVMGSYWFVQAHARTSEFVLQVET